jgi:hypothetical protein
MGRGRGRKEREQTRYGNMKYEHTITALQHVYGSS